MAVIVGTLVKDPEEVRVFKMDWSAHLAEETIANSSWTVTNGVSIVANGVVTGNTKTYVTISGGTAGHTYILTNTVYTSTNNQIWQRSGRLDVRNQ